MTEPASEDYDAVVGGITIKGRRLKTGMYSAHAKIKTASGATIHSRAWQTSREAAIIRARQDVADMLRIHGELPAEEHQP